MQFDLLEKKVIGLQVEYLKIVGEKLYIFNDE